jgi:hypothetical protein
MRRLATRCRALRVVSCMCGQYRRTRRVRNTRVGRVRIKAHQVRARSAHGSEWDAAIKSTCACGHTPPLRSSTFHSHAQKDVVWMKLPARKEETPRIALPSSARQAHVWHRTNAHMHCSIALYRHSRWCTQTRCPREANSVNESACE